MNSIIMNFDDNADINDVYDKIKSLFPDVKIIKNPYRHESEKIKRNEDYLAMLEQSREEIATGRGIAFTVEELEKMTELPIEEAKAFACERASEKGIKLWQ